jgi:hypothetical protein
MDSSTLPRGARNRSGSRTGKHEELPKPQLETIQSEIPLEITTILPSSQGSKTHLKVHIHETCNVLFSNGNVEKRLFTGEISVSATVLGTEVPELILSNHQYLQHIVFNSDFVIQINADTGTYQILPGKVLEILNSPVTIIKYQFLIDDTHIPLILNPMWKMSKDEANLLIRFEKLQDFVSNYKLSEFNVAAIVKHKQVSSVQTQPQAFWDSENSMIAWSLLENSSTYLVAKLSDILDVEPGIVQVKFNVNDKLLSTLEIESNDIIQVSASFGSGSFGSKPSLL